MTPESIFSVVLAPRYFYVQVSKKFGSLRKASSTRENICTPVTSVDVMFSESTERLSETMYTECCVLLDLYVFIMI